MEEALRQLPQVQAIKERQKRKAGKQRAARVTEARVSTTDPEARVMKMPDGGFRPAYNVSASGGATDVSSGIVLGMSVINDGTDQGESLPMVEQIVQRTRRQPEKYLMDGGFVDLEDVRTLEERGIEVYAPPKETKKPVASKNGWEQGWRERMTTQPAKEVYKQRAATAEWANAQVRQHGVSQFRVRGVVKVTAVMLLVVLAHNLLRWAALGT